MKNGSGCVAAFWIVAVLVFLFTSWHSLLVLVPIGIWLSYKFGGPPAADDESVKKVIKSLEKFQGLSGKVASHGKNPDGENPEGENFREENAQEDNAQGEEFNKEDIFEISYRSGDGESVRRIKPNSISGRYLQAFCLLRNDYRTFNLDKINWMKDYLGNEIDSPKFFLYRKLGMKIPSSEYADIDLGVNKFDIPDEISSSKEDLGLHIEADNFEQTAETVRYRMAVNCVRKSSYDDEPYIKVTLEDGETRNLSLNKITNVVNTDTGEVIENLGKAIVDVYWATPEGCCKKFAKEFSEELNVINFIARADGSLAKNEKDVIFEYFKNFGISGFDRSFVDKVFRGMKTDLADFKKSVKKLKNKDGFNADLLVDCAKGIVGCGKSTELERATLAEIESAFKPK